MEFRNGDLLQLVECILSSQNEVKRKMLVTVACNATPKSLHASCAKKINNVVRRLSLAQPPNDQRLATDDFLRFPGIYNERRLLQAKNLKERNHGWFK
jgi:hypothetical protein